jgi:hypothetical protein
MVEWAHAGGLVAMLLAGMALSEVTRFVRRPRLGIGKGSDLLPRSADHASLTKTMSELKTLLSDLELGPSIGAGTFGTVYKGMLRVNIDDVDVWFVQYGYPLFCCFYWIYCQVPY